MTDTERIAALETEVTRLGAEYRALQATLLPAAAELRTDMRLSLDYYDRVLTSLRSSLAIGGGGVTPELLFEIVRELLEGQKFVSTDLLDQITDTRANIQRLTGVVEKLSAAVGQITDSPGRN